MDEYDGDHDEIVEYLSQISNSYFVKMCLSTRPWPVFQEIFQNMPKLRLQDLTFEDIEQYVHDKLIANPRMFTLKKREPYHAVQLVQSLLDKASGVFLWVTLVVKAILKGLNNRDNISNLMRRIENLPPDLEHLYGHMLASVDPIYREEGSKIFQLFPLVQEIETIYRVLSADLHSTLVAPYPTPDDCPDTEIDQFEEIVEEMEIMIQTRCGGLFELIPTSMSGPSKWKGAHLSYIHASVADFIDRIDVWRNITQDTTYEIGAWDPNMALLMSSVLCLKS